MLGFIDASWNLKSWSPKWRWGWFLWSYYSSSHNHGSVENGCISKTIVSLRGPFSTERWLREEGWSFILPMCKMSWFDGKYWQVINLSKKGRKSKFFFLLGDPWLEFVCFLCWVSSLQRGVFSWVPVFFIFSTLEQTLITPPLIHKMNTFIPAMPP